MKFKLLFFILAATPLTAQKTVTTEEQTWFGFFNQTRLTDKWGFWFDTHLRLKYEFIPTTFVGQFIQKPAHDTGVLFS